MKKKSSRLKAWFISAFLPFATPLIYSISTEEISKHAQNIIVSGLFLAFTVFSLIEIYRQIKEEEKAEEIKEETYINEIISKCYTAAYQLMREKRNLMQEQAYINGGDFSENVLPYRVHEYIERICERLCDLVSDITAIGSEFLTVSFIYRYTKDADPCDTNWKWITGKDIASRVELNKFVEKPDTVYCQLTDNDTPNIYIENKAEAKRYHHGNRDRNFDNIGSILGTKVNFANNGTVFVEGILTISSYGKLFAPSENYFSLSGKRFRNVALYNILPFFQQLIQAELGAMYLRHLAKKDKQEEQENQEKQA